MIPADFRSTCIELFGNRWQTKLARFLIHPGGHVNPRTVRRWASGETRVPFWVEPLLRTEMGRRER